MKYSTSLEKWSYTGPPWVKTKNTWSLWGKGWYILPPWKIFLTHVKYNNVWSPSPLLLLVQVSCPENTIFCFRKLLFTFSCTWLLLPSPTTMTKSQTLWFPSCSSSEWKVWALSMLAISFGFFRATISEKNMPYHFSPTCSFFHPVSHPTLVDCGHCASRWKKAWKKWQHLVQKTLGHKSLQQSTTKVRSLRQVLKSYSHRSHA